MLADIALRAIDFAARLLAGGTFEIVLLCILLVLGLILLVIVLFVAWKLLVLLGKSLLWGAKTGGGATKSARARATERRLSAPPPVAAGWRSDSRTGLRATIREARRLAGPDALWIVVVAGTGYPDLCQSLSLPVPPGAMIGVTASDGIVLVDATKGTARDLRRLGQALPARRPFDAIAVLVDNEEIPGEALSRASSLARAAELRAALHLVLSTGESIPAWRIVEPGGEGAHELCAGLAADAARTWLGGGRRSGLEVLSRVQSRGLAETVASFVASAPSPAVDVASLSLGGEGLVRAAARCSGRTRPASVPGAWTWLGLVGAAAGTLLAILSALDSFVQGKGLEGVVKSAARESRSAWMVEGVDMLPTSGRTYRMVTLADRLTGYSELDVLIPTKVVVPEREAPRELASALLEGYVLLPLASAIEDRSEEILRPRAEAHEWLADAQRVDEWLAAWEGLEEETEEVDLAQLLSQFFGGDEGEWPERPERVLLATGARLPAVEHGGLDLETIRNVARARFVETMEHWADSVYTNGSIARAARAVGAPGVAWPVRYQALNDLRSALEDPGQAWITAAKDQPDYRYEVRIYGRSVAMDLLGQTVTVEAKAAVSRARIAARQAAETFYVPGLGAILSRSAPGAPGAGSGASLAMTRPVAAWLSLLEAFEHVGFASLPSGRGETWELPVAAAIDPRVVSQVRTWLSEYDRIAISPPPALPGAVLRSTLTEVESGLAHGVVAALWGGIRPLPGPLSHAIGTDSEMARLERAIASLAEVEAWLGAHNANRARDEVFALRDRIGASLLQAGLDVLGEEDPLGVFIDEGADRNAAVRRLGRGVERLRTVYERYASRQLETGIVASNPAASEWGTIKRDIDGHRRGQAGSAISVLEGMVTAWAESPEKACGSPYATHAELRDDYVAQAIKRYVQTQTGRCEKLRRKKVQEAYERVASYFERHAGWTWPYTKDAGAPEIAPQVLRELVGLIREDEEALELAGGRHSTALTRTGALFADREEALAVRFSIQWRTRRAEENLAEHLIGMELRGVNQSEDGTHTWRYGARASMGLRLATHSPYRFQSAADQQGREWSWTPTGAGSLLRMFETVDQGQMSVDVPVTDEDGKISTLRVTARVTHPDGRPFTVPDLSEIGPRIVPFDNAGNSRLILNLSRNSERFNGGAGTGLGADNGR